MPFQVLRMSNDDRFEEIFSDGWRDPTDDLERLGNYIIFVIGALAGLGLLGVLLFRPSLIFGAGGASHWQGYLFFGSFGLALTIFPTLFLLKESRRWDMKLTAEKLVAGGFLLGIAVSLFGFSLLSRGHVYSHEGDGQAVAILLFAPVVIGLCICLVSLVAGLLFAYAPAILPARRYRSATIEGKFAVDDKLNVIDGHPCPWVDRLTAVVVFRTAEGRLVKVRSNAEGYELANPGLRASVWIRQGRLVSLKPEYD